MNRHLSRVGIAALVVLALLGAAYGYRSMRAAAPDPNLIGGNGRIEATEIDIATQQAGRIAEILVDEGDLVRAGQVLARMDLPALEAARTEAAARVQAARDAVADAAAALAVRRSDALAAAAVVAQRRSELDAAQRRLARSVTLAAAGAAAAQELDDDRARLREGVLVAPRAARVQYRVAEPGEVLAAGGKVLNLIDLSDVYMRFFVPEAAAGRLALGAEVRLRLDAAPGFVVPASIAYVASEAQFTPKSVETASEREKLVFQVKAQVDRRLLARYPRYIKAGVPGVAWVRLDPRRPWPPELALREAR